MEFTLIDKDFKSLAIIDKFDSLIWTDRYFEPGDFNVTTYASSAFLANVVMGRYLWQKDSEHLMIIEDLWVHTNSEAGDTVILQGRSIESILDRRIIWGQRVFSGGFQELVGTLLSENVINATDVTRRIPNFVFVESADPYILSLNVNVQYVGENLLKAIQDLCLSAGVGFKITLSETGDLVFSLYYGTDRSYNQSVNPYVTFSPNFDNIINSDYKVSTRPHKTVALVAGEGEGAERTMISVSVSNGTGSGLDRREMFTDAGDVSRNVDGGTLTDEEYFAQLAQRGAEILAKNTLSQTFEGEVDPSVTYVYGKDFFLGDVVQVANEYGNEASSRVIEMIYCQDSTGIKAYPKFSTIG